MRAVVIYESAFGATRRIADAIADGIGHDAAVCAVTFATRRDLDVELLVVGGPTGRVDGGSASALVDWLELRVLTGIRAAAFDTRPKALSLFAPRTTNVLARRLRAGGATLIAPPTSFYVERNDAVVMGELDRAMEFGASFAEQFSLKAAR